VVVECAVQPPTTAVSANLDSPVVNALTDVLLDISAHRTVFVVPNAARDSNQLGRAMKAVADRECSAFREIFVAE
jgi:hypothetical protein